MKYASPGCRRVLAVVRRANLSREATSPSMWCPGRRGGRGALGHVVAGGAHLRARSGGSGVGLGLDEGGSGVDPDGRAVCRRGDQVRWA